MERESIYRGIDVAKKRVDIAVRPLDLTWSTPYDDDDAVVLVGQLQPDTKSKSRVLRVSE